MSLNGLDGPPVIEAYSAALAEAGGWFLLKYVTRDTIDLLARGSGGVVDVRIAIEQYQEKSPLYGLVQYRRRKVVLQYVPQGTSRLLQARLTVQFQSVLEKFTPHDTVFNFTAASELTESALSSACMLHASVGSLNSSSSSLHRHRLGEITEDVEEGGGERPKSGLRHSILSDDAESASNEGKKSQTVDGAKTLQSSVDSHLLTTKPLSTSPWEVRVGPPLIPSLDKSLPATPTETPRPLSGGKYAVEGEQAVVSELAQPSAQDQRSSLESRSSTLPTRPSAVELDPAAKSIAYTPYKPKVKLGPRPSAQRPHTPGSQADARPVANLPNSIRVSTRTTALASRPGSSASQRPMSQQSNKSARPAYFTHIAPSPPPPLPQASVHISALYQAPHNYLSNRPSSPTPSAAHSITTSIFATGPPGITPEKQRLMRALQLRKRQQMAKSTPAQSLEQPVEVLSRSEDASADVDLLKEGTDAELHQPVTSQPAEATDLRRPEKISREDSASHTLVTKEQQDPPFQDDQTPGDDKMPADLAPTRVDSSLDSKGTEAISNSLESTSALSQASTPSLKSAAVVPSASPVLPPIILHDRLSLSMSSGPPEHDAVPIQILDPSTSEPTIRDGGQEDAISQPHSLLKDSSSINAEGDPSAKTAPPLPTTVDQGALTHEAQAPSEPSTGQQTPQQNQAEARDSPQPDVLIEAGTSATQTPKRGSKRRETIESNQASPSTKESDTSGEGSLYDELQSATFEEAKPVMVARSPINAIFNRSSTDHDRSFSETPSRKTDGSPQTTPEKGRATIGRMLSSAQSPRLPAAEPAQSLLIKKTNVSTGISKRIRALEMFTGRSDTESSPSSPAQPPSSPITAGLVKERMSSHSPRETMVRNTSTSSSPAKKLDYASPSLTSTPAPVDGGLQNPLLGRIGSATPILLPKGKGGSVSVTARIIRDSGEGKPKGTIDPSQPATMNLHRSPLVVEHDQGDPTALPVASPDIETGFIPTTSADQEPLSIQSQGPERRRFSISSNQSAPSNFPPSESLTKRLSISMRHKRTNSNNQPHSASDTSSIGDDKLIKDSRKARLMKRMSVLTASSRRGIASAFGSTTLRRDDLSSTFPRHTESIAEQSGESSPAQSSFLDSHAHVVDIGDVNVQFPDTLLWKRRFMRIDDQGFLILTPPTMEANKRGISRRFHLSEIKTPALPLLEREELPWSIVLDFEDGSCLQCACESRYAQTQVLRMLTDAHTAYRSLYERNL